MTGTPIRKDPPPRTIKRTNDKDVAYWESLLRPLMKPGNVGDWFIVREYPTPGAAASAAYDIREKRNRYLPNGEWEATARGGALFVRYMGETNK